MTATIEQVEDAVIATLSTIPGLRGWDYLPDNFTPPCAIVAVGDIDYHGSFGYGDVVHSVSVLLILQRSSERAGQTAMDAYRSNTGPTSLRAAIEADPTLGGVVSTSIVEKSTPSTAISVNGNPYLASEFTMTVHA